MFDYINKTLCKNISPLKKANNAVVTNASGVSVLDCLFTFLST